MTRFDDLADTVARHQALAAENYDRIRALAEQVRAGFCAYLDAPGGECVRLVPPLGPFEPRSYGDEAFSIPPSGFRPVGPIVFGLAVRVSRGDDWTRMALQCSKEGEAFRVDLAGGRSHTFDLVAGAVSETPHHGFFDMLFEHLVAGFQDQIEQYESGDYGAREIGFDLHEPAFPAELIKTSLEGKVAGTKRATPADARSK